MDIQQIMERLPHRYPFLLIDRVLSFKPGQSIQALKNVTLNEPFFQGHFPSTPIMPGVLIVEAMGQAGGVLASGSLPEQDHGALIYFMGIDKVRFRKPVVPGDQLILEVEFVKQRTKTFKMSAVAKVENTIVAEAQLMAGVGGGQ
ncbi:MAG: 3-hydroxyacyl-ACP dehydratase FabZ [Desulfobacterales bacterium]|jgi:beta-hydroxyacyl-ACP dehydratase FabZ